MSTDQIGALLRTARKALGLSQKELAQRAQVSHRLWAEVERGERPNVSLKTTLRMLGEVGVSIRLTDPSGASRELQDPDTVAAARAVRAAVRRATWPGRQLRLAQEGMDDVAAARGAERLAAVSLVSAQAFAVAGAPRRTASAKSPSKPRTRSAPPSPARTSAKTRR
jgi:HTH-type transcriptional regulator/antitoxin HipB